ncbi:MAG: 50S ribosomal protein L4 [Candidatus Doudnabacteria bacterium]|nr:50S ribosomal protein L4 [Candidatus Doudnabacteria bacterium]
MSKTPLYNEAGEKVSELELNPGIFNVTKVDSGLVHLAVRVQRTNSRRPLAHAKNRGEVAGSGKKPWKQKGTGRARAGSIRSPLWRGGGVTFGPRNDRKYLLKMNRSAFKKALSTILTDKAKEQKLIVLENFTPVAKSKELASKINAISDKAGLGKKRILIIAHPEKELFRAARNLKNFNLQVANQLNAVDLLNNDILITKDALPVIEKTYGNNR